MLLAMARAYRTSQLVYVAAKLGIADALTEGPKSCEQIARELGASVDALCRVMRGLSALGVLDGTDDGRYELNSLSQLLVSGAEPSARSGVIYWGQEQYQAWGELLNTVMTGEPAFRRLFGDPFDYYDRHPDTADAFDSFMSASSKLGSAAISFNFDFPDSGTVVDVGGGEGYLLAEILGPRSGLSGVLFERPSVIEKARRVLGAKGLLGRCRLVAGDFRHDVPEGGDVYILKNVLHDWDDSGVREILSACRHAMKGRGRLIVVQRVMPDAGAANTELFSSMIDADLLQLVYTGGRERTLAEYRALLEGSGLRLHATMQSQGQTWLMEARVADRPR